MATKVDEKVTGLNPVRRSRACYVYVFPPVFAIPKSAHNSTASITSIQCAASSPPVAKAAINSNT